MRLDKYLKVSRIIKRRTLAKEQIDKGNVFLNGKNAKASSEVNVGDIITISKVDKKYQVLLLLAKSETIEKDHNQGTDDYNFNDFIKLLESCYNDSRFRSVGVYDFETVRNIIKSIK